MQPKWINIPENPIKGVVIAFTIMFLFIAFLYSTYHQRDIINGRLLLAREQVALVEIQKGFISKSFESIISDMVYLNKSPIFREYCNKKIGKNNVENEWVVFSDSKKKYDQIRYIDGTGKEIIRVNFNNGKSSKVDDGYLQNKKDRYYFTETLKLNEGNIYISKFDLNIENNELEVPIKPMIRFGLPIIDRTKTKQGVLVVNYLGEYLLEEIKKAAGKNNSLIQLVNEDSYWLAGTNSSTEWAFMYPDKQDKNFKNLFPGEWNRISAERNGQFFSSNGLFTFRAIETVKELHSLLLGRGDNSIQYESSDAVWFIISQVPSTTVEYANEKSSYAISMMSLLGSPFLLLGMITIALLFAFLLVVYLSGNEKIKTLATYDSMSGCFNRASGIAVMETMIKENNDITICFIDINGLKEVNDFLGHAGGDDLIITSVKVIQDSIRNIDLLIRLGGDEFLICFPNTNAQQAEVIWKRIVDHIETINKDGDKKFLISLSHGISILNKGYDYTLDAIIKQADLKMYDEKNKIKGAGFSVIKHRNS